MDLLSRIFLHRDEAVVPHRLTVASCSEQSSLLRDILHSGATLHAASNARQSSRPWRRFMDRKATTASSQAYASRRVPRLDRPGRQTKRARRPLRVAWLFLFLIPQTLGHAGREFRTRNLQISF